MKDLTVGKESKVIFKFAIPMLLGNVFQQMYNIVDSVIVGNYLGKEALGAVGASFPIIFVLLSLVIGIASGSTIIISQYFGAKKMDKVKQTIDTMYVILLFASIIVAIVGVTFSEAVFRLIKLPEDIMPQAVTYFTIYSAGAITMFGFNGTSAILRGLGDSKTPLYFLIFSTILNICLDLLFVLVFKWGIAGVAYATVISQGSAFLAAIIYLNKTHKVINVSFRKFDFNWPIFQKSVKIGLPSGLQQMFVALGMMALFRIVNDFGTNVVAAYSVAIKLNSFATMPAMNFAAALSTFVGQNLGANKVERVKNGFKATLVMTGIISILISAINLIFRKNLMLLFNSDTEVVNSGVNYLLIVSSFYIFFSLMFVVNAIFRGAGDTLIPMFITLLALWVVRIPVSYYLSTKMGETGIWWGIPAAWFTGAVLATIYYFTGNWKKKVVVKY